jgi:hypothetical protein
MIPSVTFAAAALILVLGGAEAGGVAEASAADRADAAARKVLDGRFQRELPLTPLERQLTKPTKTTEPRDAPPQFKRRRAGERDPERGTAATALSGIMRIVVIAVLAVAAAMIVMWILRDLRKGSANESLEGEELPEATVDQDVLQRPIGDADELARAGQFAEAIHTLLLRTLIELVRATRTRVPAALTSREILARVPLVPAARTALDALVGAVEVTYFGDDVPGPEDYQRCRAEFQRFADAYRGAA